MSTRDLYGQVFARALFPFWERVVRRRPMLDHLAYLERTQWLALDELRSIQLDGLRKLLAHAGAHVPFYRARLADIRPADVRGLDDLHRIPVLTREQAQEIGAAWRSTVAPFPAVEKTTSGTGGRPLRFGYDIGSNHWRNAVKLRGYGWAGYRLGDRCLHYWGAPIVAMSRWRRAVIDADRLLKRETYVEGMRRGPEALDAVVAVIRRVRPHAIVAYTQAAVDLARHVNERGLRTWSDLPVLCGAEPLFPGDRAVLAQAFGPGVFETYGSREVMLMATECEQHAGLHTSMENLILELVVRGPDGTTRPAGVGEVGEVLITDLHNLGMPFIRYANGDLARWAKPGRCACGRELERLESLDGRVTEVLTDGDGNRVSGVSFLLMFSIIGETVRRYQAVQHVDRSITLRVIPTPKFSDETRDYLRRSVAKYLPGAELHIELVEDIPAGANGKQRIVVVERDPQAARA